MTPEASQSPRPRFKPDIRLAFLGLFLLVLVILGVQGSRNDGAERAAPDATAVAAGAAATTGPGGDGAGVAAQTLGVSGAEAAPTAPAEPLIILFHDPYGQGFIGTCTTPIRAMEALPNTSMYVRVDCDYDGKPDVWAYTTDAGVPEALMTQLMEAAQR